MLNQLLIKKEEAFANLSPVDTNTVVTFTRDGAPCFSVGSTQLLCSYYKPQCLYCKISEHIVTLGKYYRVVTFGEF